MSIKLVWAVITQRAPRSDYKVEDLDIEVSNNALNQVVSYLPANLSSLRHFTIRSTWDFPPHSLDSLVIAFVDSDHLHTLRLVAGASTALTPHPIFPLPDTAFPLLPHLGILDLSGTHEMTLPRLSLIASSCADLKDLLLGDARWSVRPTDFVSAADGEVASPGEREIVTSLSRLEKLRRVCLGRLPIEMWEAKELRPFG
ncbi:hypothetical protein JCM8547_005277 [Rhodosporidiobolus lusitaniae]